MHKPQYNMVATEKQNSAQWCYTALLLYSFPLSDTKQKPVFTAGI